MLKVLRQKGVAKKVLWFVAGIIIISFGFGFGISRYSESVSGSGAAGKIFGKTFSKKDFQGYFHATRDQAILMHGENFRKILPLIDMENETWTRIMLLKEAEQRHIKVVDPEVISFIGTMPMFQRDGTFDRKLYETILKYVFQRDPRSFEEGIRDQIKIMKMFRTETEGLRIADEVVKKEYERRNKKVRVSYILIDPDRFSREVSVVDAAIQEYYEKNKQEFKTPDSVNAAYVEFPVAGELSDEAKAAAKATVKTAANDFYKKISNNSDLSAAAKDANLKVQETGFFSMENPFLNLSWPLDLFQQVFSAKKNTVLPPVETDNGFVLVKIIDTKPAGIPPFEQAKEQVKAKLVRQKAEALAKAKAEEIRAAIDKKLADKVDFNSAASSLLEPTQQTPFFTLGDYIPEVGISEDFQTAALDLNETKRLSNVVMTSRGPAIINWEASQGVDEKRFEEAKKDFTATLIDEQRVSSMNKIIKEIKEKAKLESYLEKTNKK